MWFIYFNNNCDYGVHYGAGPFASEECAINYARKLSKKTKEFGIVIEDYDNGEYMTLSANI